jgi:hypothetical protein
MSSALFGILQLDRGEPHGYANVAGLFQSWLQDAGGFAALGLALYLLYALLTPTDKSQSERMRVPVSGWMLAMAGISLVCYVGVLILLLLNKGGAPEPPPPQPGDPVRLPPPEFHTQLRPMLLMFAGLFALLGIGEPFARDCSKLRWRRIWALSKLGFKEAIRSRLLWVFLIILLPFLFPVKWFLPIKPSDELRTTVAVISIFLMILVLAPSVLLSAFYGIPNDIKNQTIHTVVTKPVERFEIVLGRFLGYTFLMTLVLAGLTGFSLILINATKLDEKAQEETEKARVPVRGHLQFKSRKADFEGTNVGREFDYRRYIAGHPDSPQRAIWHFDSFPSSMASAPDNRVPVEFTFDVFRMTKGEQNRGVITTFRFVTHNCPQRAPNPTEPSGSWPWAAKPGETAADLEARHKAYEDKVKKYTEDGKNPIGAQPGTDGWDAANELADEFGIFEISKEVYDYQVGGVEVPSGLFKNALKGNPEPETGKDGKTRPGARVSVYVKCESGGQLLGMAEPDLYLLEGNLPFSLNFVKGAIGLWCRLCIVIGLAVACSTYLSGVLSLLVTLVIFITGYFTDHLNDIAYNRNVGGGPAESAFRLVRTEGPTAQLPTSGGTSLIQLMDKGWAWVFRRVQNLIPDVESFTWTNFVSEGFNINAEYLVVNLLVTLGYLLPWGILAYYLMKSREIAS